MNMQSMLNGLYELISYYSTRGVGHTETMMKAVAATPGKKIILTHDQRYGMDLVRQYAQRGNTDLKVYSLDDLSNYRLRGLDAPLYVDNAALMRICQAAFQAIDQGMHSMNMLHDAREEAKTMRETAAQQRSKYEAASQRCEALRAQLEEARATLKEYGISGDDL